MGLLVQVTWQADAFGGCGNGTTEGGEECDDGNTVTESCTYGVSYPSPTPPPPQEFWCVVCGQNCLEAEGATWCGDGRTDPEFEDCDDGNEVDGDGCSSACTAECLDLVCDLWPAVGSPGETGVLGHGVIRNFGAYACPVRVLSYDLGSQPMVVRSTTNPTPWNTTCPLEGRTSSTSR